MNGNNRLASFWRRARVLTGCGMALFLMTLSVGHAAEGSAPAMSGVQEILVHAVRLGNDASMHSCNIRPDKLTASLVKALKTYGLPAVSTLESKPARIGVARVEALPEVISSNSQGIECSSWVSLTIQSEKTLRIPPIDTPRNVVVTYWRGGVLMSSVVPSHQQALLDTFDKLARKLAQQFRMDQPPPLPSLDEKPDE